MLSNVRLSPRAEKWTLTDRPRGFRCKGASYLCESTVTASIATSIVPSATQTSVGISTTWSATEFVMTSGQGATLATFVALFTPLMVTWASSDLNRFTPSSAPLKGSAMSTSDISGSQSHSQKTHSNAPTSTSAAPKSKSTTAAPNPSGLNTGAKAGIGVGVSVFALCLFFIVFWSLRRRRNRQKINQPVDHPYVDAKAELPGKDNAKTPRSAAELAADSNFGEMSGVDGALELEGSRQRHELYGDDGGHEVDASVTSTATQ